MVTRFESWREDAIDAVVAPAEHLSPNNPIELIYAISKIEYRSGITARAGYDEHRKEMRFRGRDTPHTYPTLTHLTILYIWITRFH